MTIGIDLGNIYSAIAVNGRVKVTNGYPEPHYLEQCDVSIIPDTFGHYVIPSMLCEDPEQAGKLLVGTPALAAADEGRSAIIFSKRNISTSALHRLGGYEYMAGQVAREMLLYLKRVAEEALGERVDHAVITHPAYFDLAMKEEIIWAAQEAGFDVDPAKHLLSEPVAAAFAYTHMYARDTLRILAYDLGSTFNVTVMERREGIITVKAIGGSLLLGGTIFDRELALWLLRRLQEQGIKISLDENNPANRGEWARLMRLAENTKVRLAHAPTDKMSVQVRQEAIFNDDYGRSITLLDQVTREQFVVLIQEFLDDTITGQGREGKTKGCSVTLAEAGLTIEQIDEILLVGGSCWGPWVARTIERTWGRAVRSDIDPDLCVAAGAVIWLADLSIGQGFGSTAVLQPTVKETEVSLKSEALSENLSETASLPFLIPSGESIRPLPEGERIEPLSGGRERGAVHPSTESSGVKEPRRALSDSSEAPKQLGHYQVVKSLGHGTSTAVYLARDMTSQIERRVALKIPTRSEGEWERYIRTNIEGWKRLSESRHSNILNFEDIKRIGSHTFLVMEYMDGGNLDSALRRIHPSQRIPAVIHALEQICEGLAFAHSQGVIHGDIKPQNILVSADLKQIRLGDVALRFLADETNTDESGETKGNSSLMFLAPECFECPKTLQFECPRTPQTDIYALGVTLYYLLTGKYPFTSQSTQTEQLKAERMAFQPNLRAIRADIPDWLEEVVRCCMAPNLEERFSNAAELLGHISGARERRIVLTAWSNPQDRTVEYDLDAKGQWLTVETPYEMIKGLCEKWDRIGRLALERVEMREQGSPMASIDEEIRELLDQVAEDGAHFMLGPKMRNMLGEQPQPPASLQISYDPRLATIPWELFRVRKSHLCRYFPMARGPKLVRRIPPLLELGVDEKIRVLLIVNPCGDLPGARKEGARLTREFAASPLASRLEVVVVDHSFDSFTLRTKMRQSHIIHYAGHAVFSEKHGDLSSSGWLLKGDIHTPESGDLLRASALGDFWTERTPLLIFANACVSGRAGVEVLQRRVHSDAAMGLAQAFLAAGIGNYIGTVWESPDDETTIEFASAFYREFFSGRTVSQAILAARNFCAAKFGEEDLTWARYVLFGDPFTHIPVR